MSRTSSTSRRKNSGRGAAADTLPLSIGFVHKASSRERRVATGFAWDLFLFAGVFGLPLFWRRLSSWGAAVLVLWLFVLLVSLVRVTAEPTQVAQLILFAAFLILQVWLGFFGNRLTARTLLHHGWTIDRPNDRGNKLVIEKWKLLT
ncbi:MAG TPA: hypothetical protein VHX19_07865 [Stellaceae bacterium]|nr:hypothetical protein [Stellaceae bacterium]